MENTWMERFFGKSPMPFAYGETVTDGSGNPRDLRFLAVNPPFQGMLLGKSEDCVGKTFFDYFPRKEFRKSGWLEKIRQSLVKEERLEIIVDTLIPGKVLQIRLFPVDKNHFGVILRDITQETALRDQIEGFLNISVDMFCFFDQEGNLVRLNQQFEDVLGYSVSELIGQNIFSLIHKDDWEPTRIAIDQLRNQERIINFLNRCRCKDGSYKHLEWRGATQGSYIYASARDVTESIIQQENLKTAAIIDPLTGLFNRNYFYGKIHEEILHSESAFSPLTMIAIDIDHFKYVNDIWGHPVGDEILERTARLLKNGLRSNDFLCRMGGEEFVVLLKNTGEDGAMVVAKKMHAALNDNPHPRVGKVTASFGIAERIPGEEFNQWYKRADDAVYLAKGNGRNRIFVAGRTDGEVVPSIYVSWKDSWNSGNTIIDSQHRELIETGNLLIFLTVSSADPAKVSQQINVLIGHVVRHFTDEEEILAGIGFPGLEKHRLAHQNLLRGAEKAVDDYQSKKIQTPIALSFLVTDLIVKHMEVEDAKFFPSFLKP